MIALIVALQLRILWRVRVVVPSKPICGAAVNILARSRTRSMGPEEHGVELVEEADCPVERQCA